MTSMMLNRAVLRRLSVLAIVLSSATVVLAATHAFSWPGTYDLVATGFSTGPRHAILEIARRDSTYTVTALAGPPGAAVSVRVVADTARIMWNFENEDPPMFVELRGAGDSVAGRWTIGLQSGSVTGRRR